MTRSDGVQLRKMTTIEVVMLLASLDLEPQEKERIGQQILAWTEGHPSLTMYVVSLVQNKLEFTHNVPVQDAINHLIKDCFSPRLFDADINADNQEILTILNHIRQSLLAERPMRNRLLISYREILLFRHQIPTGYTAEQQILLDIGLVTQDNGPGLKVANPIYRRVFNREWVDQYLQQPFIANKEYWVLLTVLLSILTFSLLQSIFRYLPIVETHNCLQEKELKDAIHANFSLNPQQMEEAIDRLRALQDANKLTDSCQTILHDLNYNYAIYFEAGTNNQPFNAAKRLCAIPISYYQENNIRPWFYRWKHIYEKTDFNPNLTRYLNTESCPAYVWLSSPNDP